MGKGGRSKADGLAEKLARYATDPDVDKTSVPEPADILKLCRSKDPAKQKKGGILAATWLARHG